MNGPLPKTAAAIVRRPLLAHPEDVHCVIFQLVLTLAWILAFVLYTTAPGALSVIKESVAAKAAFCAGAGLMLGWCAGINVGVNFHNHAHRKIFSSPAWNRWFGRFWTVSGGWPSWFWQHSHVTVHHAHLLQPVDWTVPRRLPDGTFENIYWYSLVHWPFRYAIHLWQDFTTGRWGPLGRDAIKEFSIFAVLWSIPFWIDPWMALWLWVLPQYFANAAVMAPGMYAQHAGCVPKSAEKPYAHSNTFLSPFFNLTMFNIGYHIEHHDHPMVHWSQLPELHEKLKGEFREANAHVVSFGYYQAGQFLCRATFSPSAQAQFDRRHPDFPNRDAAASPPTVNPPAAGA